MAARRAYLQLCREAESANAAQAPAETNQLHGFIRDSMMHIAGLLQTPCMGFVLRRRRADQPLAVAVTTPEFGNLSGLTLEAIQDAPFSQRANACLQGKQSVIDQTAATLYLPGINYPDSVMHLIRKPGGREVEMRLLDIMINTCVTGSEQLVRDGHF
jgi:hypothetical protein